MSTAQHAAFEQLLSGWRRHQSLRESGAGVDELFLSRQILDEYRRLSAGAR